MMTKARQQIVDLALWLGSDAFMYLTIMEVFDLAEKENSKAANDIIEALNDFHRICSNIVKSQT